MQAVQIPANAMVLVGDGRRALFLRNRGTQRNVELIVEHELSQVNPDTHEQGTDRPGRKHGTDGHARSAIEQTDWHAQAEDRFAREVADRLYQMGHANDFEDLVMIAPPKMLGALRAVLHPEVSECVIAELPKDLTSHTIPEIGRLLS